MPKQRTDEEIVAEVNELGTEFASSCNGHCTTAVLNATLLVFVGASKTAGWTLEDAHDAIDSVWDGCSGLVGVLEQ